MGLSNGKQIVLFSTLVIALSSSICFISYKLNNPSLSILSVLTPSLLAMVLTGLSTGRKGLHDLFVKQTIRKTAFQWVSVAVMGIPILSVLANLTSLNFDLSRFGLRTTQLMPQMIVIVFIALGEEYGWRGYLLPRLLKKYNILVASVILGLIWGVWHFPGYLIGAGVPLEMSFLVFLLWVVLGTLFISWIYFYTRNVLTSILAHIGANTAFNYLSILPEFTGNLTTFWIFIGYLTLLMVVVYYLKRTDLVSNVFPKNT
jgi:membrane protease YdiL (CAAX protease family)